MVVADRTSSGPHRPNSTSGQRGDVVVLANGAPPAADVWQAVGTPGFVVGADGGVLHGIRAGWPIDVLVGDFDSLDPALPAELEARGVAVHRYPVDKDATDLELALEVAVAEAVRRGTRVVVLGGYGKRPDHEAANLALLVSPRWRAAPLTAWLDRSFVQVAWPERPVSVEGPAGAVVSLVPLGGDALGVVTSGLTFPLVGEDLAMGATRGVSNVLAGAHGRVSLREGVLLVIQPDQVPLRTHPA